MKKLSKESVIISAAEVDDIFLLLEAIHSETGNNKVFKIIQILMNDTTKQIKTENNPLN